MLISKRMKVVLGLSLGGRRRTRLALCDGRRIVWRRHIEGAGLMKACSIEGDVACAWFS